MELRTKDENHAQEKMKGASPLNYGKSSSSTDSNATRIREAISDLATGITTKQGPAPHFVASVVSVSEDRSSVKLKLCTGSLVDVPTSILKNLVYLGTVTTGDDCLGVASGEIDASTDSGRLIQKLAREIQRLSNALTVAQEGLRRFGATDVPTTLAASEEASSATARLRVAPFDITLPSQIIKLTVNGVAGDPVKYAVIYAAPFSAYIQEWEVFSHPGCFFKMPPVVGYAPDGTIIWLQFYHEASHGTVIGTPYTATIVLSIVLSLRTT